MKLMTKIKDNFEIIVLCLLALIFIRQCGTNREVDKISKQTKNHGLILNSLPTESKVKVLLEIEGLKAEKRMIQSTDRKILDVNRQSVIDSEIRKLEGNKK
jgi:hypothetical protein